MSQFNEFIRKVTGAVKPGGLCSLRKWGGMNRQTLIDSLGHAANRYDVDWGLVCKAGRAFGLSNVNGKVDGLLSSTAVKVAHNVLNWNWIKEQRNG